MSWIQVLTTSPIKLIILDKKILAVIASANRDTFQFENPYTLNLMHENNKHVSFRQRIHYCVCAPLVRLEGQIALTKLLILMPNLCLALPA